MEIRSCAIARPGVPNSALILFRLITPFRDTIVMLLVRCVIMFTLRAISSTFGVRPRTTSLSRLRTCVRVIMLRLAAGLLVTTNGDLYSIVTVTTTCRNTLLSTLNGHSPSMCVVPLSFIVLTVVASAVLLVGPFNVR